MILFLILTFKKYRGIDDPCSSAALNLVSGVWGQLSVGFFADPITGPKGIFLGGGPNQLIVQAISCVSLIIWSGSAMLLVFWFVNSITRVKLTPEEEEKGCDLTEHHLCQNVCTDIQKSTTKLEKIISITTPIAKRFTGSVEDRNRRNSDCFYRQKQFNINEGFERY